MSAVDKTKLEERAVDKRSKPDKSRKSNFLHPLKKNEKAKKADESLHNTKVVDLLIIGGGPATLGFIMNALKTNKFAELIQNDGMAILDAGTSFGGGNLCNYGINSNTSANGFVKSILRKDKKENAFADKLKVAPHKVAALKPQSKFAASKPKPKPRNLGTDKKTIPIVDVD